LEGVDVSGRTKGKYIIKNKWGKCGLGEFGPGCLQLASSCV